MEKTFFIQYEVDTGWDYKKDVALIKAENEDKAKELLTQHIRKLGNEYMVSEIFHLEEFNGCVFTGKFGGDTPPTARQHLKV